MPAIPTPVADGDQATVEFANLWVAWAAELGLIQALGDLLYGAADNELRRLALPTGTSGTVVLTGDLSTRLLNWSAQESLGTSATKVGQILWCDQVGRFTVLNPPTVQGDHYPRVQVNASGVVTALGWQTRDELVAEVLPQGTTRPSNVADGQAWIDTDA